MLEEESMRQLGSDEPPRKRKLRPDPLIVGAGIALAAVGLLVGSLSRLGPAMPEVRRAIVSPADSETPTAGALTQQGRLYVPVYSSIAAGGGATRIDLTVTLSVRNLSQTASVMIERVDYHGTNGALVRAYLEGPQTLAELGTLEVVIADKDVQGGTGAKFLVDWVTPAGAPAPIAEAVMIGIHGTQSFSFISPGRPAPRTQ